MVFHRNNTGFLILFSYHFIQRVYQWLTYYFPTQTKIHIVYFIYTQQFPSIQKLVVGQFLWQVLDCLLIQFVPIANECTFVALLFTAI